ncbi:DUF2092 domain-containing protein [Streptacidiphilus sp. PB12-B1b]|uniref:LolA family protein n=1 Tax=Streptacidiphilus sp. PB12-B1b TaxID=2705012 RepID=UPI0015FC7F06|nr:DUF2092 domain-containing protein [Streptacidiphilus sp. PB12-B1b]QMU75021.1 DUF2092 domain-containing protein [Streptacidiphilus sp. PB12-B1b]
MGNSSGSDPEQGGAGGDLPGAAAAPERPRGRRGRVLVPAAIAGAAAAALIAVPVFAASSDLPSVTAQQLLAKMLASRVQTFSGTVQSSVDLGLPSQLVSALPSALASAGGSAPGRASGSGSASASAQAQAQGEAQAEQELASLLSGTHLFTVAADGPTRQRVVSTDQGAAFSLVRNGSSAWAYDARNRTATHLTGIGAGSATPSAHPSLDPQQAAADALKALGSSTTVSVAGQSKVAGQSVYELSVRPKGSGSTVGEVRIAVDAANGMPLEVRVLPSDGSDPILDVAFSTVSFAHQSASDYGFTPPSGATVVQQALPAQPPQGSQPGRTPWQRPSGAASLPHGGAGAPAVSTTGSGWSTVWVVKPSAQPAGSSAAGSGSAGGSEAGAMSALKEFGKPVAGGTLVSTKLVNVLVTADGTVYAGAVTPSVLEADAAR